MMLRLELFIEFLLLNCYHSHTEYSCSGLIVFQNSNDSPVQDTSNQSNSINTSSSSSETNTQYDSQEKLSLMATGLLCSPSDQMQSNENLTLSDLSEIVNLSQALFDDKNTYHEIIQSDYSYKDSVQEVINDFQESNHQKTGQTNYLFHDYLSSGFQNSTLHQHTSIDMKSQHSEMFLNNRQTVINTDNNPSECVFQQLNNVNQMKDINSKPSNSNCCLKSSDNEKSFRNQDSCSNSKNQNEPAVNEVKSIQKNFISDDNFKTAFDNIKKENKGRFFMIRSIMKYIELKLEYNIQQFSENQLFQLLMFQIRGIYFCIENNMPKNKKFKSFYDNFKNVNVNRDLESLKIISFNQMKKIQKDFFEVISIIKYSLLHNSVELSQLQKYKIISGINQTMSSLGVKNFNIKHNYEVFNEIVNSATSQSHEIKINLKNELNYSKIELKFTNGYPHKMISMCVHGQNAFILISNKFILNVFFIKLNLESLEYELFSRYFINTEKTQNQCFIRKIVKIMTDSNGNLYLVHKTINKFEIIVLNQDLVRIRMLTRNMYINVLKLKKLKVEEVIINSDLIYILDSKNFIISIFNCHFNLIKIINIQNCAPNFVNTSILISKKYLYLVSDDLIHIFSIIDDWLLIKKILIPIKNSNIACTADDEIIVKTLKGRIKFYKFDLTHNLLITQNNKFIKLRDSQHAKLVNFEIYNDTLYSLSRITSSIYVIKNFTNGH